MDLYSISLLVALVASIGAALLAAASLWHALAKNAGPFPAWLRPAGLLLSLTAIAGAATGGIHHARTGHGSGASEPLGLPAFLSAHPTLVAVAALALGAAAILAWRPR